MGSAAAVLRVVIEIPALDISYAMELVFMDGTESASKGTDSTAMQCSSRRTAACAQYCQLDQCH